MRRKWHLIFFLASCHLVVTGHAPPLPILPRIDMANFLPATRDQIQRIYSAALAKPDSADACGTLGMVLDAYEQQESAETCYRRAHLLDSRSFRWSFYLGWVQVALGKYGEAAVTFGEALRINPDYLPARLKLAESLLASGHPQESSQLYQAITKQRPELAEAHYGLGRAYAALGDATAAAASYLAACELFPPYGSAHYALALAYRKMSDTANARQHFKAFEQNRTTVPALEDPLRVAVNELNLGAVGHIRRGASMEQAGRIAEAITEQQKALQVNPRAVQAHINLISLYGRLDQMDKALEHYRTAITLNPKQADSHYNYGVLLFKQGKFQEAEKAFQQTLEINPYYAEAYNNLGSLCEQQGKWEEALRQFRNAVENRPNYRLAHFHIGRILANQEKYDQAIQEFSKTLSPEDESTPRYLYALAATYARAGDLPNALKYARTAREQATSRGQTQLLASIERDLRELEKAATIDKK